MGFVPIILSRPVFSTILASPKPLTHHLLCFFIHYLIGPLESHTYHGAVRSGNIVKPSYYISGILIFYLINLGAST